MRCIGGVTKKSIDDAGRFEGRHPFVVQGLASSWLSESDTLDALFADFSEMEVPIYLSETANFGFPSSLGFEEERRTWRLSKILELYQKKEREIEGKTWYTRGLSFTDLPGIEHLVPIPDGIDQRTLGRRNLWLSPGNTTHVLHYDISHNLLVVRSGTKHLKLFPHSCADLFYTYPPNSGFHHISKVDLDNLDYERFPKAAQAEYFSCTLGAGDALYMPAHWFHHVKTDGPSMAVNFWWRPPIEDSLGPPLLGLLASHYVYYDLDNLSAMVDLDQLTVPLSRWLLDAGDATAAVVAASAELIRDLRCALAGPGDRPQDVAVNRELDLCAPGAPLLGLAPQVIETLLRLSQDVRLRRRIVDPAEAALVIGLTLERPLHSRRAATG